jgi:hypothetical protein
MYARGAVIVGASRCSQHLGRPTATLSCNGVVREGTVHVIDGHLAASIKSGAVNDDEQGAVTDGAMDL